LIIVLGSVIVEEAKVSEALEQSKMHVARSRAEPGCISHAVYQDPEVKGKLVFVEKWQDQESLAQHFQVPASGEFVKSVSEYAVEPPSMSVFMAERVEM
jgi:quinol monooxygenase YgiN